MTAPTAGNGPTHPGPSHPRPTPPPPKLAQDLTALAGLLGLTREIAAATTPAPSSARVDLGPVAKALLLRHLARAQAALDDFAAYSGIKLPARQDHDEAGEGASVGVTTTGGPGQTTSREEVRPAPGYDAVVMKAADGSRGLREQPDAGARAEGGEPQRLALGAVIGFPPPAPGTPPTPPPDPGPPPSGAVPVGVGVLYDALPTHPWPAPPVPQPQPGGRR